MRPEVLSTALSLGFSVQSWELFLFFILREEFPEAPRTHRQTP